MNLEWRLASRYLSTRSASRFLNLSTLIAIGGVCVGVMALIVVMGVMSGLQSEIRDAILGTNPHITVLTYGEGLRMDEWEKPLVQVTADDEVTVAEPFVYSEALIFKDINYQQGVALRGVSSDATDRLSEQLIVGNWRFDEAESDLAGIVLGFRIADRLLVYPGDTVNMVSGHGAELTPAGFIPKFKKFEVIPIFSNLRAAKSGSFNLFQSRKLWGKPSSACRRSATRSALEGSRTHKARPVTASPSPRRS